MLTWGGIGDAESVHGDLAVPAKKLRQAAQDFAAVLIGQLFSGLQEAFSSVPGAKADNSSEQYSYMAVQAMASELAASGGFGLTAMLSREMQRLSTSQPSARHNDGKRP